WICHGSREVRLDKSRRNARHAQLIAGFLSQGLGNRAHSVLRASIDRHGRYDLNSGGRNDIDEMSEILPPKHRQGGGNAVQNAFEVDVDHLLPVVDAQLVEERDWRYSSVVDENIQLAVSRNCQ